MQMLTGGTGNVEDLFWMMRYGKPEVEKHRMTVAGEIPNVNIKATGTPYGSEEATRRASGYLFGKRWPSIAVPSTRAVSFARDVFGEHDPALHATAIDAAVQGATEGRRRRVKP